MQQRFNFKSDKKVKLNDVFNPKEPYELQPTKYQFVLKPNCEYWRFGVILTNEKHIPNTNVSDFDRYKFSVNQYLQVNVGTLPSETERLHPQFLQITDMEKPPFHEVNGYQSLSPITFTIEPNFQNNIISYSCTTVIKSQLTKLDGELALRFNEFIYLAVWSDYNEFELECEVTIFDAEEITKTGKTTEVRDFEDFMIGNSDEYAVKDDVDPTLDVHTIAEEIVKLTNRTPSQHGTLFGIFGRWGRGKTYLMKEIWKAIETNNAIRINRKVDFHAWKYQDTLAVWGYLYEQFANEYFKSKKNKLRLRIRLNLKRKGKLRPILFLIGFTFSTILVFIDFGLKLQFLRYVFSIFSILQVVSLVFIFYRYSPSAKGLYNTYFTRHNFSQLLGVQAEVQKELQMLLEVWAQDLNGERIALFVDDIDRCPETLILQIVDALRVMVEDNDIAKHLIVIVSMDERILRRAIQLKYSTLMDERSLISDSDNEQNMKREEIIDLVNEYFDKLFIVGIKLGELDAHERVSFFRELIKDNIQNTENNNSKDTNSGSSNGENNLQGGEEIETLASSESQNSIVDTVNKKDETQETSKTPPIVLSALEAAFFEQYVSQTHGFTPRQIKIIYYRYLLARSLLKRFYENSDLEPIWHKQSYCEVMIFLVVKYSENLNQPILPKHRMQICQSKERNSKIYFWESISIKTSDYKMLLNVLDLVIAY